jgi:GT2 family glycosyltransferase
VTASTRSAEVEIAESPNKLAPTVAVVVCAYSEARWGLLREGIGAILAQSRAPDRVILVIDHNPALLERARGEFGERVTVMPNGSRQGLSGARNTGVGAAEQEIVAFLDDDAVPEPGWLAAVISAYEDGVLGVGGAIEPDWATERPRWFPPEFDWVVGCTYAGLPATGGTVRNLIGAAMSLRRSVFERVGGFRDELGRVGSLPFGCEETELCIRAAQAIPGGVFRYQPAARVRHWVGPERTRFGYFARQCFNEGRGKALMSELVGSHDGLAAERGQALRVLPAALLAALGESLRTRDAAGLLRGGAILAGLLSAAAGYAVALLRRRL